ncbi:phosphotransferase family protein [Fodinicola acaciae]|uniref:phosphotransferase family protein n=1 Tax=Fodinicola acaciae TaxID=2681555 RepID=UPI0013D72E92|nr:aminoglycoside phosphotransferase family protein [Fodinicola acaciae]
MTATVAAPQVWRGVLPDRPFVTLPSRRRPVVIAENQRQVRSYVRTALLTAPPGSRLPGWVFGAAQQVMRAPASWRLMPALDRHAAVRSEFAEFVAALGVSVAVLNHSHDPDTRCVVLMFDHDQRWPVLAAKLPSGPAAASRVRREADRLAAIARLSLGDLRRHVPAVVEVLDHDGLPVLVTTGQPGVPMLVHYHRAGHTADPRAVRADFAAAGRWLAAVRAATADGAAPMGLPDDTVQALRDRHGLAKLDALQSRMGRYGVPRTVVHGDFWPGNILLTAGRVSGVVDWEWSRAAGNPVRDLARFAVGYSSYLDRHTRPGRRVRGHPGLVAGEFGAGVAYALDGSGWYPDLVRRFLTTGLRRFGVPAELGRDAALAEVAAIAAESADPDFASRQIQLFNRLAEAKAA